MFFIMKHGFRLAAALLTVGALAGCTTVTQSNPSRTATEQLLISSAADRAADRLQLGLPPGTKIFLDVNYFDGYDAKYAVAALQDGFLRQSLILVDDRSKADAIVVARAGALSTSMNTELIGTEAYNVPIPLSSGSVSVPEIPLYKSEAQTGVAKFAATVVDARKGTLIASMAPQFGFAETTKQTVLIFITWKKDDIYPQSE